MSDVLPNIAEKKRKELCVDTLSVCLSVCTVILSAAFWEEQH